MMLQAQAGLSHLKGYDMEYIISVLALIVSVVKTALMWFDYKDCKKAKRTQTKTKQSHKA